MSNEENTNGLSRRTFIKGRQWLGLCLVQWRPDRLRQGQKKHPSTERTQYRDAIQVF